MRPLIINNWRMQKCLMAKLFKAMQNLPLMLITCEWLALLAETSHSLKISQLSKLSTWIPLIRFLKTIIMALYCPLLRLNGTELWERHRPCLQERSMVRTVSPISCSRSRLEDCATSHGKAQNWPKSWESPCSPPRSKRIRSFTQLSLQQKNSPHHRYHLYSPPNASKRCSSHPIRPRSEDPPCSSTLPSNRSISTTSTKSKNWRSSSGRRGRRTGRTSGSAKLATRMRRNRACCKSISTAT